MRRVALALCLATVARSGAGQTAPRGPSAPSPRTPPVVVIEYDPQQSSSLLAEGITRVTAELRVAGFEVQLAAQRPASDAPTSEPSGPALPLSRVPYATVRLSEQEQQLSFEIRAEASGTPSRLLILGRERDVPVLALKSVEFLRAGLAPHIPSPPPLAAAPVTIQTASAPSALHSAPRRLLQLDLGGAVLSNLGTGDQLPLLTLHPAYLALPRLALGVALAVPLGDARFQGPQGAAFYRVWLGSITANGSWLKFHNGELTLGASIGVARTAATAVPDPPLEARQSAPWALTFGLDAGLAYEVIPPLAVVAEARLLTFAPSPTVAAGEDERRLGRPCLVLGASARIFYR